MKILLVSDDENLSKELKSKLIFLRRDDEVEVSSYSLALKSAQSADIVLVHETQAGTLELIKELRKNSNLCIILLVNSYNKELILSAYDEGIDDFSFSSADDFELVIRCVNNIKHNSIKLSSLRNEKLLEQLSVIDEASGFYNHQYSKQVIENIIDTDLLDLGVLMVISPTDDGKEVFSADKIISSIYSCIRVCDVAILGKGAKFFIFMPKTDINGAVSVFNKIKHHNGNDFEICAGISDIAHKSFEEFEDDALQALSESVSTKSEFVFAKIKENSLNELFGDEDIENKNYKIFRQIFNKKLEKIITPVFFRLQKVWEDKLINTKIEQFANSEQCVFHLKNEKQDSTLRIVYPGFAKILITITHEGLDSPENHEMQLSLNQVSVKELVSIVEDFIREYKYTAE